MITFSFLIDNNYKLFLDQSEPRAVPAGCNKTKKMKKLDCSHFSSCTDQHSKCLIDLLSFSWLCEVLHELQS